MKKYLSSSALLIFIFISSIYAQHNSVGRYVQVSHRNSNVFSSKKTVSTLERVNGHIFNLSSSLSTEINHCSANSLTYPLKSYEKINSSARNSSPFTPSESKCKHYFVSFLTGALFGTCIASWEIKDIPTYAGVGGLIGLVYGALRD